MFKKFFRPSYTNSMRPGHLATLVATAVRSAVSGRYVLNVKQEADRIAAETGFAVHTVASELVVGAIKAKADIEFPRMKVLDSFEDQLSLRINEAHT